MKSVEFAVWLPLLSAMVGGAVAFGVAWLGARLRARTDRSLRLIEAYADLAGSVVGLIQAIVRHHLALRDQYVNDKARADLSESQERVLSAMHEYRGVRAKVTLLEHDARCRARLAELGDTLQAFLANDARSENGAAEDNRLRTQSTKQLESLIEMVRQTYPG